MSYKEAALSPPDILLPEPTSGWEAAINAANRRRDHEADLKRNDRTTSESLPSLEQQFQPGKARYGAEVKQLQAGATGRDKVRGLQEQHRQNHLTELHKKPFNLAKGIETVASDQTFDVPSQLSDKPRRKGAKRERRVIDFTNEFVQQARADLDARSLGSNSAPAYKSNWKLFLKFCEDHDLDPELRGKDQRKDEQLLINYIDFEYMVHKNKWTTIRAKLSAIRWYTISLGYENPVDYTKKPKLKRRLDTFKKLRGTRNPKKTVTITMLKLLQRKLMKKATAGDTWALGISAACILGYFFMLRVGEFAAEDSLHVANYVIKKKDVKFFKNGRECMWHEAPDKVSIHITGSKTDQGMEGVHRSLFRSYSEL